MELNEKMSYLLGLFDGMDIDTNTKEGRALVQMAKVMQEAVKCIDSLQSQIDELTELCDILDSDLGELEEDFYSFDECGFDDCDFDDDELYEVCCPDCGNTVILNGDMLDAGAIECPECGQNLEFEFDDFDDFDEIGEIEELNELDQFDEIDEIEELDEIDAVDELEEIDELDELNEFEEQLDDYDDLEAPEMTESFSIYEEQDFVDDGFEGLPEE